MPNYTQADVDRALAVGADLEKRRLDLLPPGMRRCWHCAEIIPQRDTHCQACGAEQRPVIATALPSPQAPHWAWGCLLGALALGAMLALVLVITALQAG